MKKIICSIFIIIAIAGCGQDTVAPTDENGLPVGPWKDPGCMATGSQYYDACCKAQTGGTCGFLKPGNTSFCTMMQAIYSGNNVTKTDGGAKRSACCSGSITIPKVNKKLPLNGMNFTPDTASGNGDCPTSLSSNISLDNNNPNQPICVNYLSNSELNEEDKNESSLPGFVQKLLDAVINSAVGFTNKVNSNATCPAQ